MRIEWIVLALILSWPGAAAARLGCAEWSRLPDEERTARVERMIDGHVFSKKGRKYTSENRLAMKRCLVGFVPRIVEDFDDACLDPRRAGMDALDDIFDRYFLSCVQ